MKSRILLFVVAGLAMAAFFAGCGKNNAPATAPVPDNQARAGAPEQPMPSPPSDAAPITELPDNPITVVENEKPEAPLPDVVAKIGDVTVTGKEFQRQLDFNTEMMNSYGMPIQLKPEQKRELLEDLVRERVMEISAAKAGVTASDEEVQAELDKGKKNVSEEDYEAYLKQTGMQETELRNLLKSRLIKDKFYNQKTKDITVSDGDISLEYEKLKAEGNLDRNEKTADFSHILVKVDGDSDEAWNKGKEKIDAARARIAAGEKFEDVAKQVSEDPGSAERGGAYRETGPGKMVPEVDSRLFTMPMNEVSEPFKTKFGWHIMKVTAVHEPGTATLAEVKELVSDRVKSQKSRKVMEDYIEEVTKGMKIEVLYPEGSSKDLTPLAANTKAPTDKEKKPEASPEPVPP